MMPKTIGIIGFGAFGAFLEVLIRRFLPAVSVRIHSSRFAPDGEKFFSLEDTCASDALIIACSIRDFEKTLREVVPLTRPDTIIVDVATVKLHTVKLLKELADGRPYLATHPMFGPESYQKRDEDVSGFRVVITDHTLEEESYDAFVAFLREVGFDVISFTADRHDRHLAETLCLTHFIGQSIALAGFERTEIDTVSFGFLMDAVESVKEDMSLFSDVYRFNPYCEETLERFSRSEDDILRALKEAKSGE